MTATRRVLLTLTGAAMIGWGAAGPAGAGIATGVSALNDSGTVSGEFLNATGDHAFLRDASGAVTTFAVPGSQFTSPYALNDRGEVAGLFGSGTRGDGGFIRVASGAFTTFNVTGIARDGTLVDALNNLGEAAGSYYDPARGHFTGFLRDTSGAIATFGFAGDAHVTALNNAGEVAGWYEDANQKPHGFLRDPSGAVQTFDVPGGVGTRITALNNSGEIAGTFGAGGRDRVFLRDASGNITTFTVGDSPFVSVAALNASGEVIGRVSDFKTDHGFFRDATGAVTTFVVPGCFYTDPVALNDSGEIAGLFNLPGGVGQSFLRGPSGTFTTIQVAAVPEPSSLTPAALGCILLIGRLVRVRRCRARNPLKANPPSRRGRSSG